MWPESLTVILPKVTSTFYQKLVRKHKNLAMGKQDETWAEFATLSKSML